MALTAYCKKCREEVEPGEICRRCGTKLGRNAAHSVWCVERVPARDWMCWNSVTRVLLPAGLMLVILVILAELIGGGPAAVEQLLSGRFLPAVGIILGVILLLTLLVLLLRGKDLVDYTVDSRGVHAVTYLPHPTPLKLLARLKSPALLRQAEGGDPVLKLDERFLPWSQTARVQLWPEKCTVIYYAPSWWARVSLACTPFTWDDALTLTREKLGKKKKVRLPDSLRIAAAPAAKAPKQAPAMPVPDPYPPEEDYTPWPQEEPEETPSPENTSSEGQISMDL